MTLTLKIVQDDDPPHPRKEYDNLGIMVCFHKLYDHSGLTMSTGAFADRWDSGQVGYIYVPREAALVEYGALPEEELRDRARACLQAEVETYDMYLRGDVYGYTLLDERGETVESCWGFYGEQAAKEEGQAMLTCHQKERSQQENP